jgi:hypothetical protein
MTPLVLVRLGIEWLNLPLHQQDHLAVASTNLVTQPLLVTIDPGTVQPVRGISQAKLPPEITFQGQAYSCCHG